MQLAIDTRKLIEEAGLPVGVISGCGTGTHAITGVLKGVDEVQAGSYATMDAQYRKVGAPFENALTLLATVLSRPRPETAIVDAGLKTCSAEFGEPTAVTSGATYTEFSEEHGTLQLVGPRATSRSATRSSSSRRTAAPRSTCTIACTS